MLKAGCPLHDSRKPTGAFFAGFLEKRSAGPAPLILGLTGFRTKQFRRTNETISARCEEFRKQMPAINLQSVRGSIMLAAIFDSIYREFVRNSLSEMRKFLC